MGNTSLDTSLVRHARGNQLARWLWQHWLIWLIVLSGIWVVLPWLAPIFLHYGWNTAAWLIYTLYSF